jgi:spermidine synthase
VEQPETWITEQLVDGVLVSYRLDDVIIEIDSDEQHLILARNPHFGKMLVLDNIVQITEADEFAYSEMMAHVPIIAHGAVRSVLIVGGGDGAIAQEVLLHQSIERCVLVDIDREVISLAGVHLREVNAGIFDDPRFVLHVGDGSAFVHETSERFDVVIVDSTDPVGPGEVLFTRAFYEGCHRSLRAGGILVTQNGVPTFQADELVQSIAHLRSLFVDASCYLAAVPTYMGGHMALGWASDEPAHRQLGEREIADRWHPLAIETRYYTPAVHRAAFALPRFIEQLVA